MFSWYRNLFLGKWNPWLYRVRKNYIYSLQIVNIIEDLYSQ